jgi:hypothetical protein
MKLNKDTRAKLKLSNQSEIKKVRPAAKVLLDFGLISDKKAALISRHF